MTPGITAAPADNARRFGVISDSADTGLACAADASVVADVARGVPGASRSTAPAKGAPRSSRANALAEYREPNRTISGGCALDGRVRKLVCTSHNGGTVSGHEVLERMLQN